VRSAILSLLRASWRFTDRLDRAGVPLLGWISSRWKRQAVRGLFRLASPLLPRAVTVQGVRITAPRSHLFGYVLQPHEPELVALFDRYLGPGMTAVDVGANIGYLSLQMARRVGPAGRVLAVEPAPENLAWLRHNLALNGCRNVEVVAAGAGAARRRRRLHTGEGSTRHSFHGPAATSAPTGVEVDEIPIDELVGGPVHLVKIDVEGAELEVLDGMRRILRESPDLRLIVEWSPYLLKRAGQRPERLVEMLAEQGFSLRLVGSDGALVPIDPDRARVFAEETEAGSRRGYTNLLAERPPAAASTSAGG